MEYNFIDNDYHHLKERYERRVRDFESLVRETSVPKVFCYHTRDNNHCAELYDFINETNYIGMPTFRLKFGSFKNTFIDYDISANDMNKYIFTNINCPLL